MIHAVIQGLRLIECDMASLYVVFKDILGINVQLALKQRVGVGQVWGGTSTHILLTKIQSHE